jgi:hypothetical protein
VRGVELSVHRFERGAFRRLGPKRLLDEHEYAQVQDEECLLLIAPDGGEALTGNAGPEGAGRNTDLGEIGVSELTPQIAELLFEYARGGGFALALWPQSLTIATWDRVITGETPLGVFATSEAVAREVRTEWPRPIVCHSWQALYDELSRRAT